MAYRRGLERLPPLFSRRKLRGIVNREQSARKVRGVFLGSKKKGIARLGQLREGIYGMK